MLQQLRSARKNESGFTLIELLIVIVILGVLSGIVVFAVSGINDRGNAAACKSDKASVEVAVEAYYAKLGKYPADMAALTTGADKFLRNAPSTDHGYSIVLTADTGVVASVPADCNNAK